MKVLFSNKKVFTNYFIEDTYECGLSLKGTEVKSICNANSSIDESFVIIKNNEAFVINMYIAPFKEGSINNVDPSRNRKLLLHKNEIISLDFKSKKNCLAIIPTKVYLKNGKIKMEICLCKSKKNHDKREDMKNRDMQRESKKFK